MAIPPGNECVVRVRGRSAGVFQSRDSSSSAAICQTALPSPSRHLKTPGHLTLSRRKKRNRVLACCVISARWVAMYYEVGTTKCKWPWSMENKRPPCLSFFTGPSINLENNFSPHLLYISSASLKAPPFTTSSGRDRQRQRGRGEQC